MRTGGRVTVASRGASSASCFPRHVLVIPEEVTILRLEVDHYLILAHAQAHAWVIEDWRGLHALQRTGDDAVAEPAGNLVEPFIQW